MSQTLRYPLSHTAVALILVALAVAIVVLACAMIIFGTLVLP